MDTISNTRGTRPKNLLQPGARPRGTGVWPSSDTPRPTSTVGTDAQRSRSVTHQQPRPFDNLRQDDYWMRSVSFAGLHRILNAVAAAPDGLDEYCAPGGGHTIMFPLSSTVSSVTSSCSAVMETVRSLLSLRTSEDWSIFSIYDLIVSCCQGARKPRAVLFGAIDWLLQEWPHHTVLVRTSPGLATLNTTSVKEEDHVL